MPRIYQTPLDLSGLEILNVRAQQLTSDPSSASGKFYYNTTDNVLKFHNGTVWISLGRLDQISAPTADLNLNNQKIINLAEPVAPQDAATKNYVDLAITGLDFKQSVRVKTTGSNITLSGGAPNTLDGVSLSLDDRILVADQTAPAENGLYYVSSLGTGANGTWSRTPDADTSSELTPNSFVFVEEGTANADSGWVMTSNKPFTLGTTSQTWVQFTGTGQITAGAGLTKTGNTIDVVAADGSIIVNADSITVGLVPISKGGTNATSASAARTNLGVVGFYNTSVGNGVNTSFTVTHNLGTLDVVVGIYRISDGVEIEADVTRASINTVTVAFATVPTSNQYRVMVHAGV